MKINSLPIDSVEIDSLTNGELIEETLSTIRIERSQTTQVIRLFEEISRRKLYLDYAYPSLYEMAVNHFGYCAGSAMRRINAMKMIRDIPDVAEKLESGALSLSVVSEVQSFFYQEARNERPYSIGAKIELIEKSVGMSRREVERELANRNPEREKRETSYAVSNGRLRVSFTISKELNEKLNCLKDLLGHVDPNMTTEKLIERLAEYGLDKHDPQRKSARAKARSAKAAEAPPSDRASARTRGKASAPRQRRTKNFAKYPPPPAEVNSQPNPDQNIVRPGSRYIPANERRKVHDDGKGCTFVDATSGHRCSSKKFLQLDHIDPCANGGANEYRNLRWLCGAHNRARTTCPSPSHRGAISL